MATEVVVIDLMDDTNLEKLKEYLSPNGISVVQKNETEFQAFVCDSPDALNEVTDLLDDNSVDCYVSMHENN